MIRLSLLCGFYSFPALFQLQGQSPAIETDSLAQKIQGELAAPFPPQDGKVDPTVPHGEFLHGSITNSPIYPGTENDFQVYVPAQYDPAKPACLLVKLDGLGSYEGTVLDNLIAQKDMPVTIGVGISPGIIWRDPPGTKNRRAYRFDRSYEFDSVNDYFPDYVLNELLPTIEKMKTRDGRPINISCDGNDHAVMGASTGGIGSFTLAWRRPDEFTRVYSVIGTYVSMRGGHDYPALIRKTEPKAIRIFLEDGSIDAWNPLFGSWYDANLNMESALSFAGYDVAHAWGTHGHDGRPGATIFPDVMRWLWSDYPAPIKAGSSKNSTLQQILVPGQPWEKLATTFQSAAGLAVNASGDVYVSDATARTVYQLGIGGTTSVFLHGFAIEGETFGPDGKLYGLIPTEQKIVTVDPNASIRVLATGIGGHNIVVTHNGTLYVSEPAPHSDMPSHIWRLTSSGNKNQVDEGLHAASGVAFSPNGCLFFAAENTTQWIYSYLVQPDGSLANKQRFYWLHMSDIPNDSGTEDMAMDSRGYLYVATNMGVQVCDQNGRVRAILPMPSPCGPVRSLCFGGPHFDVLYATDGKQVFKRPMKVSGLAPCSIPVETPSEGPG